MVIALASAAFDPLNNSPVLDPNEVAIGLRLKEDTTQIQCAQWYGDLKRLSEGSLPYADNNLIIGRIQFRETNIEDRITLWNISNDGTYDLSETPKITYTCNLDQSRLNQLVIFDNGQQRIDEIRIAVVGSNQTGSDALAEILPGITNITIPDLYVSCTKRGGTDVSASTLIDSDSIRLDVDSVRKVTDFSYQYQIQATEPTSWATSESFPFWNELFFYREAQTQWVRITATDIDNNTISQVFGLTGGALTAPVDDPIGPWDYVEQCGVGYNWNKLKKPSLHEPYSDPNIFYRYKRAGFGHYRVNHTRVELAAGDDGYWDSIEVFVDAIEDTVDRLLRHGLYPIVTGGASPYEDEKDTATYTYLGDRLKYKSHRVAFEYAVEFSSDKWGGQTDPTTGLFENMGLITQNATDRLRTYTSTHNAILGGILADCNELDKHIVPTGMGEYYFYQWHHWANGINSSDGYGAWPAQQEYVDTEFEDSRLFSLSSGKPCHTGAIHTYPGRTRGYGYTTVMVDWIKHIKTKTQTAPDGRVLPIPNSWFGFDNLFDFDAFVTGTRDWFNNPFLSPVIEVLNDDYIYFTDDRDGDGLSNSDEIIAGTSPDDMDTDNDHMGDYLELYYNFDPLDANDGNPNRDWAPSDLTGDGIVDNDADADGMLNADEVHYSFYWPNNELGMSGMPSEFYLNPLDANDADFDPDRDGINSMWELINHVHPQVSDNAAKIDP